VHLQTLASGSRGNATLVRAGDTTVLVDCGLPLEEMGERLAAARVSPLALDHILVTHGHLDHARSAGALARRARATLHCAEAIQRNAAIRRSKRLFTLRIGSLTAVAGRRGEDGLAYRPVPLPHDAVPTVAFALEHAGRRAVIVTDMGRPCPRTAAALRGAHVLVLEFNHDVELLRQGPYPAALQRRILGGAGHLSNEEAARMLVLLAGPELHTLVLAHLSEKNNTPELALAAARRALASIGRADVEVLVASQDAIGPNLGV
jgi:phosphoribosyl 1,2-cyclic phosphodiesterase